MDLLLGPLEHAFFVRALLAAAIVGTVCAVVGTYVVLRGLAFIGDAISHAAFPGVVGAFLATLLFPRLGISLGTGLLSEILFSALGAIILLLIVGLFRGRRP